MVLRTDIDETDIFNGPVLEQYAQNGCKLDGAIRRMNRAQRAICNNEGQVASCKAGMHNRRGDPAVAVQWLSALQGLGIILLTATFKFTSDLVLHYQYQTLLRLMLLLDCDAYSQ
jgi:hypothetical protein